MLGPQGTLFFLLLVMSFAGLMAWLIITKQVVLRVVAAMLAFLPAMVFGVAAVNKYFDYYQNWSSLVSDLSGQSVQSVPQLSAASVGQGGGKSIKAELASVNRQEAAQTGFLFRSQVTGPKSHITRSVYIWLPPQYFSPAFAHYRFPAIELLHGSPGNPESWVNIMDVDTIYLQQLEEHKSQPAVLVMPDTDGGLQYGLQCLNEPGGLQDMTFVGKEVQNWAAANLRVQPPGTLWGIAGYSAGGYCAANIALQYASRYGFAGSLSGYFAPVTSQVPAHNQPEGAPVDISPFARNPKLKMLNSPDQYILRIPLGVNVPQFYLAAGGLDLPDVQGAEYFRQLLLTRVANVPTDIVAGGGHQAMVWRDGVSNMLPWMTGNLFTIEQRYNAYQNAQAAQRTRLAGGKTKPAPRASASAQAGTSLLNNKRR